MAPATERRGGRGRWATAARCTPTASRAAHSRLTLQVHDFLVARQLRAACGRALVSTIWCARRGFDPHWTLDADGALGWCCEMEGCREGVSGREGGRRTAVCNPRAAVPRRCAVGARVAGPRRLRLSVSVEAGGHGIRISTQHSALVGSSQLTHCTLTEAASFLKCLEDSSRLFVLPVLAGVAMAAAAAKARWLPRHLATRVGWCKRRKGSASILCSTLGPYRLL